MTKTTNFEFKAGDYFIRDMLSKEQYLALGNAMVEQGFELGEFHPEEGGRYRNFEYFGIHRSHKALYHSDGDSPFRRHLTYHEVFNAETTKGLVPTESVIEGVEMTPLMKFFMESTENQVIYHFRHTDKAGKVTSKGGGTAVLVRLPVTGEILIGLSACSKDDNFDRKSGVMLAKTRLKATGQFMEKVPAKHELRAFIGRYCDDQFKTIAKSF